MEGDINRSNERPTRFKNFPSGDENLPGNEKERLHSWSCSILKRLLH